MARRSPAVKQDDRGVDVVIQAGAGTETLRADRVVCALPCPVIGRIFESARLSGAKAQAIREQYYSRTVKVFLQTRTRFWLKDGLSGHVTTDLPIERLTPDPGADPGARGALTAYPIGAYTAALERMTEAERVAAAREQAQQIFPELPRFFEGGVSHCWGLDPWQRGSFALHTPGQIGFIDTLATPEGRIHFAGEHTSAVDRLDAGRARVRAPRRARDQPLAPANCFIHSACRCCISSRREIFLVRRDRPLVAVRIGEAPGAIAPELILHRAHRPGENLRAGRDGAVEQRVAVLHIEPERRRRAADRFGTLAPHHRVVHHDARVADSDLRVHDLAVGPTARDTSSAPSAFLYHSIACAALSRVSCGVTVWYPSGTAFFAFVPSRLLILAEGLCPSDSPTRGLARRFDGSLRSRGSLAALARAPPIGLPCTRPRSPLRRLASTSAKATVDAPKRRPVAWLARGARVPPTRRHLR